MTKITQDQRQRIYSRDDYSCVYCNSRENLTVDHLIPFNWSRKVNYREDDYGIPREELRFKKYLIKEDKNLITACESCNGEKGNKPLKVFFMFRQDTKENFVKRVLSFVDKRVLEAIAS